MPANRNFAVAVAQVITAPATFNFPETPQANRVAVTLDVTAVSGTTPSLSAQVEGLDLTTGKWVLLAAFAAKTAVATETVFIGGGADSKFPFKQMRLNVTAVTGTTPSFTVTCGASTHTD